MVAAVGSPRKGGEEDCYYCHSGHAHTSLTNPEVSNSSSTASRWTWRRPKTTRSLSRCRWQSCAWVCPRDPMVLYGYESTSQPTAVCAGACWESGLLFLVLRDEYGNVGDRFDWGRIYRARIIHRPELSI
jgi:hypothetical protein